MEIRDFGPGTNMLVSVQSYNVGEAKAQPVDADIDIGFRRSFDPSERDYNSLREFTPTVPSSILKFVNQDTGPYVYAARHRKISKSEWDGFRTGQTKLFIWFKIRWGDFTTEGKPTKTLVYCRSVWLQDLAGKKSYFGPYRACE